MSMPLAAKEQLQIPPGKCENVVKLLNNEVQKKRACFIVDER
jgi:hypothetical protein